MQRKHTTDSIAESMSTGKISVWHWEEQTYGVTGDTLVSGVHAAVG